MYAHRATVSASLGDVLRPLGRIAVAAAVMSGAVAAATIGLRHADASAWVILLSGIVVGAAVFVPLLFRLQPDLISALAGLVRGRRQANGEPGVAGASVVTPPPKVLSGDRSE